MTKYAIANPIMFTPCLTKEINGITDYVIKNNLKLSKISLSYLLAQLYGIDSSLNRGVLVMQIIRDNFELASQSGEDQEEVIRLSFSSPSLKDIFSAEELEKAIKMNLIA